MTIIRTGDKQFAFVSGVGASARAKAIGMTSVDEAVLIWWIASTEYSDVWDVAAGSELRLITEEGGPELLQRAVSGSGGQVLPTITYGEIPSGFWQVTPETGPPAPLVRGRRYTLHFLGNAIETLDFHF